MRKEALRYLANARAILKKAPREDSIYTDVKFVQEACSTAYLALLKAIDEYLLGQGVTRKELPKSFEQYQKALRKYLSVRNGKLFKEFDSLYNHLHIAGYYRGLLDNVQVLKDIFTTAQEFIHKLS